MSKIEELVKIIKESRHIVFFGGAGVSTESNIPDFRSPTGIYNVRNRVESLKNTNYTPEEMISHSFFMKHTNLFFDYYFDSLVYPDAKPNYAHIFLALMEKNKMLDVVITQNIDGLHQDAGSINVIELHGSVRRNYCMNCHHFVDGKEMLKLRGKCDICGGIIKPDVVLYEESLNMEDIEKAIAYISNADCLIVGGTSLQVYPAASFVRFFKGKNLVIINKEKTPMDIYAKLCINDSIGVTFKKVNDILGLK